MLSAATDSAPVFLHCAGTAWRLSADSNRLAHTHTRTHYTRTRRIHRGKHDDDQTVNGLVTNGFSDALQVFRNRL